jgi:hypothetical protein
MDCYIGTVKAAPSVGDCAYQKKRHKKGQTRTERERGGVRKREDSVSMTEMGEAERVKQLHHSHALTITFLLLLSAQP